MKSRQRPLLVVIAVLQALAIVWLAVRIYGSSLADPAEPVRSAAPPVQARAEAPIAEPATPVEPSPVGAATDAPPAALELAPSLVFGNVTDRDGHPLDANVMIFPGEDPQASADLMARDGGYAWPGLPPGRYRVTATAKNHRLSEQQLNLAGAGAHQRLDFRLEPSWLLKVVLQTPDGQLLHDALAPLRKERPALARSDVSVIASWTALPSRLPPSDLRETPFTLAPWQGGRFARPANLPHRYAGQLEMPELRDAFVAVAMREFLLATAHVEAGQEEVTMVVDPQRVVGWFATATLQVVDAQTGRPIAGARVNLSDAQSTGRDTRTDAEGRASFVDLAAGRLHLGIYHPGHTTAPMLVDLAPGITTDIGKIAMHVPFTVKGRLVGRTTDPVPETPITLTSLAAPPAPPLSSQPLRFGIQNDEFSCRIVPGRYRLHVSGIGGAILEFDTADLGDQPLIVMLQPEANLRLDSVKLTEAVHLVLHGSGGALLFDRWITWKGAWDMAVLPGSYTAELRSLAGQAQREELIVPTNGARYVLR